MDDALLIAFFQYGHHVELDRLQEESFQRNIHHVLTLDQ